MAAGKLQQKVLWSDQLRTAITHSRNIISIRLLKEMGIDKAVATAKRFGFTEDQIPKTLSLALGSGDATALQMAQVYATFANGGFLIKPYFIERIESDEGEIIYQAKPKIACPSCDSNQELNRNYAPRIITPQICFLMNSLIKRCRSTWHGNRRKSTGQARSCRENRNH